MGTAALLSVQVVKHSEITDSKEPCIQIKDYLKNWGKKKKRQIYCAIHEKKNLVTVQ